MPDQYVLSAFQRMELAKAHHTPVMAEIDLVSSHTPWAPLPHMVPWNQVGDGSIFNGMPAQGQSPKVVCPTWPSGRRNAPLSGRRAGNRAARRPDGLPPRVTRLAPAWPRLPRLPRLPPPAPSHAPYSASTSAA